jgi:hypothetical protein
LHSSSIWNVTEIDNKNIQASSCIVAVDFAIIRAIGQT